MFTIILESSELRRCKTRRKRGEIGKSSKKKDRGEGGRGRGEGSRKMSMGRKVKEGWCSRKGNVEREEGWELGAESRMGTFGRGEE